MKVKLSIKNINQEEFKEIFGLSSLPQLYDEFKISDICNAKNISVIGDGIIEGEVFNLIISLTCDVAISLFSSFLYDKIKSLIKKQKVKKKNIVVLKINNKEIDFNDNLSIERAIEDAKPRQWKTIV